MVLPEEKKRKDLAGFYRDGFSSKKNMYWRCTDGISKQYIMKRFMQLVLKVK